MLRNLWSKVCPLCDGTGKVAGFKCRFCNGTGQA